MRSLILAATALSLAVTPVLADGSDSGSTDQQAAAPAPLVRSIACPVLYTHEIASQAVFRRFVTGLVAAGYQPTTLAAVDAAMTGAADRPRGCAVLTFDDSLLSQYLNAVPVLLQLGLPAVFFVLPGFSDGVHRYMGSTELQALAEDGFEVELHTCNHPNLPLLAQRNLNAFYAELQDCRQIVEDVTGQPVNYVAYPFGAYDPLVLSTVARFGFRAGFTTAASAILNFRSPYALPRIRYDPSEAPPTVVQRIKAAGG